MDLEITIKNYRCFSDDSPVTITIGKGFTALVGPNNCGKSSLLKLFLEIRDLWRQIGDLNTFTDFFRGHNRGVGIVEVYDAQEIFCDSNTRPITLEISVPIADGSSSRPVLKRLRLICGRDQLNWSVEPSCVPDGIPRRTEFNPSGPDLLMHQSGAMAVDCSSFLRFGRQLSQGIYIGPFRNALNDGSAKYYDISVGTDFINTWNEWKTGENKSQNKIIESVTEDVRRIFGFNKLEINASLKLKTLQVSVNGRPYKLRELGAGIAQFIVVLGNVAIRRPDYIFIDEPELHLHPSLQADFMVSLTSYANEGVVFATHSIGLARTLGDRIYSLQRRGDSILCRPFEQTPNYAEFVGEMSFSSFKELGFEKILLVEGVTDVKTVQQFLRLIDKDHKIVVLPLGGDQLAKGNVELELTELTRITSPSNIAALVDSERGSAGAAPIAARTLFEQSCKKLGFKVQLTQRRAFENYLSDQAIKEELGSSFKALDPYEALKSLSNAWDKRESWRIARRMKWQELETTDVGEFLASL